MVPPGQPQGPWGRPPRSRAGNAICSEQMIDQQALLGPCLNHVNSTKVAPENLSLVHSYGERKSPRCLSGPRCRQLNQTLQIGHDLQTALSPSTWLTLLGRNNPYYPYFYFYFFATSLRLCSQTPSTATQWDFTGRSYTTYVVAKVGKFTDPNGKAYPQIPYIFKLYFQLNYFEKKKTKPALWQYESSRF